MTTHRGISVKTKEWVYGYLVGSNVIVGEVKEMNEDYFYPEFWQEIHPETAGMNTGIKHPDAKNKNDIYEGDIFNREGYWPFYVAFEKGAFVKVPCDEVQRINHDHVRLELGAVNGWNIVGNIHKTTIKNYLNSTQGI